MLVPRTSSGEPSWLRRNLFLIISGALVLGAVLAVWWTVIRPYLTIDPQNQKSSSVLVAAIALTGPVSAAAVAAIGHILQRSASQQTARLTAIDQQRLQMQAAMDTVRLLTTADGQPAPQIQVSAALIVLSRLGETALALDLAAEMWPKKEMTSSSAITMCDAAILSGDVELQRTAAMLLYNNWRLLKAQGSNQVYWPPSLVDGWPKTIDAEARDRMTDALRSWVDASPGGDDDFRNRLVRESDRIVRE